MENVRYLKDYAKRSGPCSISFHSATYRDQNGRSSSLAITINVENGEFQGVLDRVKEQGVGGVICDDGAYRFLPWPPAVIEIRAGS